MPKIRIHRYDFSANGDGTWNVYEFDVNDRKYSKYVDRVNQQGLSKYENEYIYVTVEDSEVNFAANNNMPKFWPAPHPQPGKYYLYTLNPESCHYDGSCLLIDEGDLHERVAVENKRLLGAIKKYA